MAKFKSLLVLMPFLFLQFSLAQEGILDTDFGDQGITRFEYTDKGARAKDLILLEDNSIILGVNSELRQNGAVYNRGFYIYKLTPIGEIDISFGQNGQLYFPNNGTNSSNFSSILLQFDGKILIKGSIEGEGKLIRIDQNGVFDPSFGINGIQSIPDGSKIGQQSTGKIIIQSQYFDGNNNMYSFSRRNTDGSLDTTFGNNGIQITDVTNYRFDLCFAIKIDWEDKILAGGPSYDNLGDYHSVITRFNENGALDTLFGDNGTVITNFGPGSNMGEVNDIAVLGDKIILGGNYQYYGGTGGFGGIKPAVAKFNNDGTPDQTFGQGGKVVMETYFGANDRLRSIAVQRDGKIILGGGASMPFPYEQTNFFVIKLNNDGSIYSDFGDNGIFITDFGGSDTNYVTDLVLQTDNKVLAFGVTTDANDEYRNAIVCRLDNEVLGIHDLLAANDIQVYPNPSNDYFKIKSKNAIQKLEIYNLLGQLVATELFSNNTLEIEYDFNKFQNGIYTIVIISEDEHTFSKKIIKN
ncbi:MAG: T9SS type A sorting domain-containing protein [Aequorivita sp.]|nr:T9SS type A sorting domain-containing protein [Aequorivita sp.]